jgi:hypothetical protein
MNFTNVTDHKRDPQRWNTITIKVVVEVCGSIDPANIKEFVFSLVAHLPHLLSHQLNLVLGDDKALCALALKIAHLSLEFSLFATGYDFIPRTSPIKSLLLLHVNGFKNI